MVTQLSMTDFSDSASEIQAVGLEGYIIEMFISLVFFIIFNAPATAILIHSLVVIFRITRLEKNWYKQAMNEFQDTYLASVLVQEDFWYLIKARLSEVSWLTPSNSNIHRFEEHLDHCACHFHSYLKLQQILPPVGMLQMWLQEITFQFRLLFSLPYWIYIIVFLSLSIFPPAVLLLYIALLVFGGRYIASRGVLIALCGTLLQAGAVEEQAQPAGVHAVHQWQD
jgi:hypothetical protein